LHVGVLFALLGAFYGAIAALDSRSEISAGDHPYTRVALGACFGAAAVFVVWSWFPGNFHAAWQLVGAMVGGILGWFGWSWARFVDV
jgi:hypothetical protein